jgi:hypothetical protein
MRLLLVQPTTKYPDRRPLRSRTRWFAQPLPFSGAAQQPFFHWATKRRLDPVDFY